MPLRMFIILNFLLGVSLPRFCFAAQESIIFSCSTFGQDYEKGKKVSRGEEGVSDAFRSVFELYSLEMGNIRIQDPKPLDRITNCKLKLKWLKKTSAAGSYQERWFGEYQRGICNPERPFEKTALFDSVMVWISYLRKSEKFESKIQFVKKSGVETCKVSIQDSENILAQLSKWESASLKKRE